MNIEYMKQEDRVFVTEEDGNVYEREYNNNIEKILTYENILELLNKKINKNEVLIKIKQNDINAYNTLIKIVNIFIGFILIFGTVSKFIVVNSNISFLGLIIVDSLLALITESPLIYANNNKRKNIKTIERENKLLTKEKEQVLKELKKISVIDTLNKDINNSNEKETHFRTLKNSEYIEYLNNLKEKINKIYTDEEKNIENNKVLKKIK